MAIEQAAFPNYGQAVTQATSAVAVDVPIPSGSKQLMLTVTGAQAVYFRVKNNDDNTAATVADALVNAVNRMLISRGEGQTKISVVSPGGASSIHIIPCEGMWSM